MGLAMERKLVTVLFADAIGSTSLADRLDPERLRTVLDAYFATMAAAVDGWGGTVEKFIGDAVMAVFGVPAVREDDAERALRAAMEMMERLRTLNEELQSRHGVSLRMRAYEVGRVETTAVYFAALSAAEIAWYVASGEGLDKAGAYGIQGLASRFIPRIEGSYSNVVGLPLHCVYELLNELGVGYPLPTIRSRKSL